MKKQNNVVKTLDVSKMSKTKIPLYVSFWPRLILDVLLFLLLLISGTFLLNNSLLFENEEIVKYNEKSNLDYKVYLLKNDFYKQPYLEKDKNMLYVSSLIDKIELDFDYEFTIDSNESVDFDYSIIGKLEIKNKDNTRLYFEKTYTLLEDKHVSMKDATSESITEKINVDYQYYNDVANSFISSYGIDTNNTFKVYMLIKKSNGEGSDFKLDNSSVMNVSIPLSQRSIEIGLDYNDINSSSSVIKDKKVSISNIVKLLFSVILIILSLIMLVRAMRKMALLHNKKSDYDKFIEKILKEYDRLIAETTTLMSFNEKEVIKVNKFTELLDIHDNLQLPIMYYSVVKHHSAYFYIAHDKTIYLYNVKETDFDDKKAKN